tara:strand:+ start:297 stop:596 length:300 start_codon:yes stop_codon:yes gene_type:complete
MQKHTKIYFKSLGHVPGDFIACEISGQPAIDIHHITGRGRGGTDRIENLMALTRELHNKLGDKQQYMYKLLITHRDFLQNNGVKFDNNYFNELIKKYEI